MNTLIFWGTVLLAMLVTVSAVRCTSAVFAGEPEIVCTTDSKAYQPLPDGSMMRRRSQDERCAK
jgi:hypothetical protein